MGWVLYCISQHPEVEKRILDELEEAGLLACAGNPKPRPIQWDDLGKLRYLDAVIKVPFPFTPPLPLLNWSTLPFRTRGAIAPTVPLEQAP